MRKLITTVLALLLAACASSPYGNYLPESVDQQKLASEAVKQLTTNWPPARTRLELQQPATDAFGVDLLHGLRGSGYAVREFSTDATQSDSASPTSPVTASKKQPPRNKKAKNAPPTVVQAYPLWYLVDQIGTMNLYRLTLKVGDVRLTRSYRMQNGVLSPAGAWLRQE